MNQYNFTIVNSQVTEVFLIVGGVPVLQTMDPNDSWEVEDHGIVREVESTEKSLFIQIITEMVFMMKL